MERNSVSIFAIVFLFLVLFSPLSLGQTITSISEAKYTSYDRDIAGPAFLVSVTMDGSSQSLIGELTKDEIDEQTTTANKIKQGFELEMDIAEQTCKYPIERTYDPIYRVMWDKEHHYLGIGDGDFEADCDDRTSPWPFPLYGRKPGTWDYYCIWLSSSEGEIGKLSKHMFQFRADITMTLDDDSSVEGSLSNTEDRSAWIGDKVFAKFTGLLWSGLKCPAYEATNGAVWSNGQWYVVKKNAVTDYTAKNKVSVLYAELDYDPSKVETLATIWNIYTDAILIKSEPPGSKYEGKQDLSAGQVTYTPTGTLFYPEVSLRIKADWVGIHAPTSQPEITFLGTPEFQTGETGYLEVKIKNTGDSKATFVVSTLCDYWIDVKEPTLTGKFEVGDEKTMIVKLSGYTPMSKQEGECTVKVYDMDNPKKKDEGKTTVTVKKIITCSPEGVSECYGETLRRVCVSGDWSYYQCGSGETCDYVEGNAMCVERDIEQDYREPGVCAWWNLKCKYIDPALAELSGAVKVLLVWLGALLLLVGGIYLLWKIYKPRIPFIT